MLFRVPSLIIANFIETMLNQHSAVNVNFIEPTSDSDVDSSSFCTLI